jgi:hypothetical protein
MILRKRGAGNLSSGAIFSGNMIFILKTSEIDSILASIPATPTTHADGSASGTARESRTPLGVLLSRGSGPSKLTPILTPEGG